MGKIQGRFCEKEITPIAKLDKRSLRWKAQRPGKPLTIWIRIGCPRGKWKVRTARCSVGTRANILLVPRSGSRACPPGQKLVQK